jgi:beta-lactamase class A
VFTDAGASGFLHVREIGMQDSMDVGADTPVAVAVAPVIKVVIAVAFARAVRAGVVDPTQRVTVPSRYQLGGTGTPVARIRSR